MNERTIQREFVMNFLTTREENGGLGYISHPSGIISPDMFILADLKDFVKKADEDIFKRLVRLYKGDEMKMVRELADAIKDKIVSSQNVATFINGNKTITFGHESVPLFYYSGSELSGDTDFNKNIFTAVEEVTCNMKLSGKDVYSFRPDICFFVNGIFLGYLELKTVAKGQSAKIHGRSKIAKDYLSAIQGIANSGPHIESDIDVAMSVFHKAIHIVATDCYDFFITRDISKNYKQSYQELTPPSTKTVNELIPPLAESMKEYPLTSPMLSEEDRFKEVMTALYSKRMVEKEIRYYNFIEYRFKKEKGQRVRISRTGRLIVPRPKQKFGCDKIMYRIDEMLLHESDPDFYKNKLRDELRALEIPESKITEIIALRERYCNNKYVYSLLMQYAAGFGKSNIIGWLALQLKDYRYNDSWAYDKILLIVDRIQLRDQLDLKMMNMNIDKSMFTEAIDKKTFIDALRKKPRIIVINIQKFEKMEEAIAEAGVQLNKLRVAFLIDEIHRSQTGKDNQQMIDLFSKLQQTFNVDGKIYAKKNLLVGFTATPSEETLERFGEFLSATTYPYWKPFDSYSMREAIDDGYILDPTKNIVQFSVPIGFELPPELVGKDDIIIRQNKASVYAFEPRMRKIAEFIVNRLVSHVYRKIGGHAKAMLAVSSIPNAIKYCKIIRELFEEKCKDEKYSQYKNAPITIVYSDNQSNDPCSVHNDGLGESSVIAKFQKERWGLMIVVDKLQTGFDEPRLHTLFLDKEITDINCVQTICRVNRTMPGKEDCQVVDCTWKNVNKKNIKEAFAKYCEMVTSDYNPEEEAKSVEKWFRILIKSEPYRTWYSGFLQNRTNATFFIRMEGGFREWIVKCYKQEEEAIKYNKEHELKPTDPDYKDETNAAREVRKTYGQFNIAITNLKNVFEIDEKYYDDAFTEFWVYYCNVFSLVTRVDGGEVYEFTVVDSNEPPSIIVVDDDNSGGRGNGGHTGPKGSPRDNSPKGKSMEQVLAILKKLNDDEKLTAYLAQIYLKQIGLMFDFIKSDSDFMAIVKDKVFDDDKKLAEYEKQQFKYFLKIKREGYAIADNFNKLMKDNSAYLFNIFINDIRNVENGDSDFDYDTTDNGQNDHYDINWEELMAEARRKYRPVYDEEKLKETLTVKFAPAFANIAHHIRSMEEVVDNMMMVLSKPSNQSLDGINELLKNTLNMLYMAEGLTLADKRQYLTTLLIKFESYLKKLYFLIHGTDVPTREEGQNATLSNAIFAFDSLRSLKNSTDPAYHAFWQRLDIVRDLRNRESHGTLDISESEVNAAIHATITMYLFSTATNITDLEAAGHYAEETEYIHEIPIEEDNEDKRNSA